MGQRNSEFYAGKILRVDLSRGTIKEEVLPAEVLKNHIGGTGIGGWLLYHEVPPGVQWQDPANKLTFFTGPLAGTKVQGSGTFSVVTKGSLTNGATASQANGYLGAFLRFNGLIGLVFEGASKDWVYLSINNGSAELKSARHLVGVDTWETETRIKKELGQTLHGMSVFSIGPAGENLVKYAAIVGDRGHVAAHNGCGAVMGAKKLKAIAVSRGGARLAVSDEQALSALADEIYNSILEDPKLKVFYDWGTGLSFPGMVASGQLPVKNMSTNLFPEYQRFSAQEYRKQFEIKPSRCWGCRMHHLHIVKVTQGPYAGYTGEEPDYEGFAAWGPLIGQTDPGTAVMLNDVVDRLGLDTNEAGWAVAFAMDCYTRGIISSADTDGLKLAWGDAEVSRALLQNIAERKGFGNVLAEGVKRAAEHLGGEALQCAAYINKGHAPRGHDHRARWSEILDYATSGQGTIETGPLGIVSPDLGLAPFTDAFSPDQVAYMVAMGKPKLQIVDCLGVCYLSVGWGMKLKSLVDAVNAVTGWDLTMQDAVSVATRNVNLFRAFNIRHGIGPEVEFPSALYSSVPVDGPARGKDIKPHWDHMLDIYYKLMGWDRKTGKPLPETLDKLGLADVKKDLW